MTYRESVDFLYGLQKHGIKPGLDTILALLSDLGHPELRYPSVHIGGTNGKGSTAAMAASMFQASGYRVGLYTSPHLVDFRERIRVNGEQIPEAKVVSLTEQIRALRATPHQPTFFEFTTALAFQYFAEECVDVAVIEVGLGGRFDATNVVNPAAVVITNVALDHQQYLGNTVAAIASEKAGIIKRGVPVVVGRVCEEAWAVISQVAAQHDAPLYRLEDAFTVEGCSPELFTYRGIGTSYPGLSCPLLGRHQLDNASCALAALEAASRCGLQVSEAAVREGLRAVRWEGRLEVIEIQPRILLDGAHNPSAAAALAGYLAEWCADHPGARLILVVGMMRDKDHQGFLEHLLPLVDEVIVTQANIPRAARAEELAEVIRVRGRGVHIRRDPCDALRWASELARPHDLVLVTGSLVLVGAIKASLLGCELSPLTG